MVIRRLVLAGLLLAASPAFAQQSMAPPRHHDAAARIAAFENRLADLQARLQLTAAQKPLWDNFVLVVRDNMHRRMERFRARAAMAAVDAPARLDGRLEMLRQEARGVEREKAALAPLWSMLDPAQKATLSTAIAWHRHHGGNRHHHAESAE